MVKLFVEGGGDNDALRTECRRAFTKLLERAGFKGRMPRIVASGSRRQAFDQFGAAMRSGKPEELPILLVDAEGPVTSASPWDHVAQRSGDKWDRPAGATDDHLHLMVECMESWFLADRDALERFFGKEFNPNALPAATAKVESVHKPDLFDALKQATRSKKGAYGKGQHSFKVLETLDPARIRQSSPWAERFFATLDRMLA